MEQMRVLVVDPVRPDAQLIAQAANVLRHGGLVAFPTETVYGVGADAGNPAAIDRLNRAKGRPPDKAYSIHLYDRAQLDALVDDVSPLAERLIAKFWPGPLTIVMPAKEGRTIGFRLPDHPVALAFLKACGRPVVAPSANRSGTAPATDAAGVLAAQIAIDCVLDAGPTPGGRESTVVSVLRDRLEFFREGALSRAEIEAV
jgi:L-threonylcarbamoyladenylate synthase